MPLKSRLERLQLARNLPSFQPMISKILTRTQTHRFDGSLLIWQLAPKSTPKLTVSSRYALVARARRWILKTSHYPPKGVSRSPETPLRKTASPLSTQPMAPLIIPSFPVA